MRPPRGVGPKFILDCCMVPYVKTWLIACNDSSQLKRVASWKMWNPGNRSEVGLHWSVHRFAFERQESCVDRFGEPLKFTMTNTGRINIYGYLQLSTSACYAHPVAAQAPLTKLDKRATHPRSPWLMKKELSTWKKKRDPILADPTRDQVQIYHWQDQHCGMWTVEHTLET